MSIPLASSTFLKLAFIAFMAPQLAFSGKENLEIQDETAPKAGALVKASDSPFNALPPEIHALSRKNVQWACHPAYPILSVNLLDYRLIFQLHFKHLIWRGTTSDPHRYPGTFHPRI
ncbi:MAG: hypothetical protein ACRC4G_03835 [Alphaproteobacteria bacterium]